MNRVVKTAMISVAAAATALSALSSADAGERWRHHRYHHRHSVDGDLAIAGLLGLAAGALAVGLASRPAYREPIYVDPQPRPYRGTVGFAEPGVVYLDDEPTGFEPWSAEWYAYCSDRYRSFDGRTGTFTGYDGQQHFCVAD